jgi:hypothetical protein
LMNPLSLGAIKIWRQGRVEGILFVLICCAVTHIFSSSFSPYSLLLNNGSWQASKGGNSRSRGFASMPSCPSSSSTVRGNDFLSLWLSCINPLNMQGYLSCSGTSAKSGGGWTTMNCTSCWVQGIFIFIFIL